MAKRYCQSISVFKASSKHPACFFWRGRRYVILEIINRWTKNSGWWRGEAAVDRQYASVLARAYPGQQVGIYELCFDRQQATWTLTRVQD